MDEKMCAKKKEMFVLADRYFSEFTMHIIVFPRHFDFFFI